MHRGLYSCFLYSSSCGADGLEAQRNDIRKGIEYRETLNRWVVASTDYYIDAGRSAKDQNRPELQRLKADVVARKIDIIFVVKLDRLTRSLLDFVELWDLFAKHDVRLLCLRSVRHIFRDASN
ncbi:recombinase family protein [Gimesia algae]|uniref:recombinase family protein n=1 Tax=Gimesia algae TaxID=2527971 RepID=UPI00119ECF1C